MERTETGVVRLLIAPCPDYDVHEVSVLRDEEEGELERWAASSNLSPGSPGEVELFRAPAGWEVYRSTLKDLNRPGTYVADIDGAVKGSSLDSEVTFTIKQLQDLKAGKVITGIDGGKVMERDEFLKPDSKRCS
ncbi:hypothetical protein [Streptomyces sp. NPDC048603]|uniref:hypothetical protein n=1 Tax=Streptomyces sp. NPDC048603 TaxID=3365577 RepID=UPI00371820EA